MKITEEKGRGKISLKRRMVVKQRKKEIRER